MINIFAPTLFMPTRALTPLDILRAGLTTDGLTAKLDRLWVFAQPTQAEALVDIIAGATATAVNSPTFTANLGFTGDGATSYIDTNFNPSTMGINYTLNSAHGSLWDVTSRAAAATLEMGALDDLVTGAYSVDLSVRYPVDRLIMRINAGGGIEVSPSSGSQGHFILNRSSGSAIETYFNGGSIDSSVNGSYVLANVTIAILGRHLASGGVTGFSTDQIAAVSFGSSLDATDAANLYSRLRTYMRAVNPIIELREGLRDDGILAKLDRLWVFAQPTEAEALVDIIAGSTATAVNSPTFAANLGYTGGSTKYIDTNFNASVGTNHFVKDSACAFGWAVNAPQNNEALFGMSGTSGITRIIPSLFGTSAAWDTNDQSIVITTAAHWGSAGLWAVDRDASASETLYWNGASENTSNQASWASTPLNEDFVCLMDGGSNYCTTQIGCYGVGQHLTAAEQADLYSRLRTYMTAVGVP